MLVGMPVPQFLPIGLRLGQAARTVERAFAGALGEGGGPLPVWLILLNLKISKPANQRELAEAVGVREATLTHHLNAMDTGGLVPTTPAAANRRIRLGETRPALGRTGRPPPGLKFRSARLAGSGRNVVPDSYSHERGRVSRAR